eukprot:TRINITY_DN256_c0_g2_i1.p1 TRINITY_DN256_c0_g2~~TRINITY_DN256_c0_g2_i1.p1  ORF type:complete len:548 (+),score=225.62 TRINITY_DN256_c0_g2_i1:98-1741(+)
MDFDEGMGEKDPGPLVYQEVKVFHTEPCLINVYDNPQQRFCTFEVYGLDTQAMLKLVYEYTAFDNLFRFNAELMNPNRKEGRYHWVIERLAIQVVKDDRKLKLGEKPSEEVGELPIYETVRKIPTGRMDLKERQRLREQMDILDIRRTENIMRKRTATKERVLKHIFFLKEEAIRRKQEQADRMAAERALSYKRKEEEERKEEEALKLLETKQRMRRKAIESVNSRNEEQEEFELAQMRLRWKAADEEKERIIKDALDRRAKMRAESKAAAEALRKKREDARNKRLKVFKQRDSNQKAREEEWLKGIYEAKTLRERAGKMRVESKQANIREWNSVRMPIFGAQLARTQERALAREAEGEAVNAYVEKRAVPKKEKTKGNKFKKKKNMDDAPPAAEKTETGEKKKKKKDDKKEDKKDDKKEKEEKSDVADVEKVLDSVENKVRAEMEEERRRARMAKVRGENIDSANKNRSQREVKHLSDVRQKHRAAEEEERRVFAERILVMKQKEEERQSAISRKKVERERLDRCRQARIAEKEKAWLAKVTAAGG